MGVVYANGALTKVTAQGGPPNGDEPGTAGTDRWTGNVGVTVRERHVEQIGGGRIDEIDEAHLILPYDLGAQVVRGDTLTFTDQDGAEQQRIAGTIIRAKYTGRVRVDLEDA